MLGHQAKYQDIEQTSSTIAYFNLFQKGEWAVIHEMLQIGYYRKNNSNLRSCILVALPFSLSSYKPVRKILFKNSHTFEVKCGDAPSRSN